MKIIKIEVEVIEAHPRGKLSRFTVTAEMDRPILLRLLGRSPRQRVFFSAGRLHPLVVGSWKWYERRNAHESFQLDVGSPLSCELDAHALRYMGSHFSKDV